MTAQDDMEQLRAAWATAKRELRKFVVDDWPAFLFAYLLLVAIAIVIEVMT